MAITDRANKLATVDVLGVQREVSLACIVTGSHSLDDCIGEWVLMHVGFAMSRIDEREAQLTLDALRMIGHTQIEREALLESGAAEVRP